MVLGHFQSGNTAERRKKKKEMQATDEILFLSFFLPLTCLHVNIV